MIDSVLSETKREEPADTPSREVVQRVAAATQRGETQLPLLYDAIDPDSLDRLVSSAARNGTALSVRFTYADQRVVIDDGGFGTCSGKDGTGM